MEQSTEDIIKQQDEIIGNLTRRLAWSEDSVSKRNEWLRKAKKEAGYSDSVSFDDVWKEVLEKSQKYDQLCK
jgi:hypothetical protein